MATKIGDVKTIGRVTDWTTTIDDRQTKVALCEEPWNAVIDNGYHENGNSFTFSGTISVADWATVKGYWTNRTLVTIVNEDGESLSSCRVLIKSYKPKEGFEKKYVSITLEIWRL